MSSSATTRAKRKSPWNLSSSDGKRSVKKIMVSTMNSDQDESYFFALPRELRNRIYHFLWSGTKFKIRFAGMQMYIMYEGEDPYRSYLNVTELPTWLAPCKAFLAEGLDCLYKHGELLLTPATVKSDDIWVKGPRDDELFNLRMYSAITNPAYNTKIPSSVINPFQLGTLTLAMEPWERFSKNQSIAERLSFKQYHRETYKNLAMYLGKHISRRTNMKIKKLRIELYAPVDNRVTRLHVAPYAPIQQVFESTRFNEVELLVKDPGREDFNGSVGAKEPWFGQFKVIMESLLGPKHKLVEGSFYDDFQGVFTDTLKGTRKG